LLPVESLLAVLLPADQVLAGARSDTTRLQAEIQGFVGVTHVFQSLLLLVPAVKKEENTDDGDNRDAVHSVSSAID
jgi:hypothetical protein